MEVERKGGREAESNVRKTQQSPSHTNTDIPSPCEINCAASSNISTDSTMPLRLCRWCIPVCCSVLQRVAVCCSVLQCVAVAMRNDAPPRVLQCDAADCSVLQWLCATMHHPVCCSAWQFVAVAARNNAPTYTALVITPQRHSEGTQLRLCMLTPLQ